MSDKRTVWQVSGSLKHRMSGSKFSEYYKKLVMSVQERYRVKPDLVAAGLDDRYTFDSGEGEIVSMPEVEYPDIYIYITF